MSFRIDYRFLEIAKRLDEILDILDDVRGLDVVSRSKLDLVYDKLTSLSEVVDEHVSAES